MACGSHGSCGGAAQRVKKHGIARVRSVAEGEGFEPPVPFRVQWFSRPPPSTTRPSLRIENLARIHAILPLAISHQNAHRGALILGRIAQTPYRPEPSVQADVTPSVTAADYDAGLIVCHCIARRDRAKLDSSACVDSELGDSCALRRIALADDTFTETRPERIRPPAQMPGCTITMTFGVAWT
jgi:hypothetical protein